MVNQYEKLVLHRSGPDVTSVAGYAGGSPPDPSTPNLCYHNSVNQADYGELGHAEVVSLTLPGSDAVKAASKVFFLDFRELEPGQWTRRDVFDRGSEYRALIGIPGGVDGPFYKQVEEANEEVHGLKLMPGVGGDDDTIDTGVVWVYDSEEFAVGQAEVCLQFRDDNPAYSEPYSEAYHELAGELEGVGKIMNTTCPVNFIC